MASKRLWWTNHYPTLTGLTNSARYRSTILLRLPQMNPSYYPSLLVQISNNSVYGDGHSRGSLVNGFRLPAYLIIARSFLTYP